MNFPAHVRYQIYNSEACSAPLECMGSSCVRQCSADVLDLCQVDTFLGMGEDGSLRSLSQSPVCPKGKFWDDFAEGYAMS